MNSEPANSANSLAVSTSMPGAICRDVGRLGILLRLGPDGFGFA